MDWSDSTAPPIGYFDVQQSRLSRLNKCWGSRMVFRGFQDKDILFPATVNKWTQYVKFFQMGSYYVAETGLELLGSSNLPASAL